MENNSTNRFYNPNAKPNRLINLIDDYKRDIARMKDHFYNDDFKKVIEIYEEILRNKPDLKLDSSMVSYSYNMLNKPQLSESFFEGLIGIFNTIAENVNELIVLVNAETKLALLKLNEASKFTQLYSGQVYSAEALEGLFITAQGYLKGNDPVQALHIYYKIIRVEGEFITPKHFFRAFTKIAEIMVQDDSNEDAELASYYLGQGFQYFQKDELNSPAVGDSFNFYKELRQRYPSPQFENFLRRFDAKNHNILRITFGDFYSNDNMEINIPDLDSNSSGFLNSLKEIALNTENEAKEILSSLKGLIMDEEPTFAYVYA